MADSHHDNDFEKQLSGLSLAKPSAAYLEQGIQAIRGSQPGASFWRAHLPLALTAALVLSVTANVFQLLHNRQQPAPAATEQMAQCNTPIVTTPPGTAIEFAVAEQRLTPLGMC